jgi:dienelactone hydrolase
LELRVGADWWEGLLSIPKEIAAISRPVSFALGEHDEVLPAKSVEKITETLAEKKTVESEVKVYEGAMHGRSDYIHCRMKLTVYRICVEG